MCVHVLFFPTAWAVSLKQPMWHPRAESFIRDLTLKNKFQELDQLDLHFLAWHAASVQIKPCWCKLNHGSAAARPISRYRFIQTLILVNSFGKNLTFQNSCHVFFRLQSRITATVIGVFIQLFCFFNMCVFFFLFIYRDYCTLISMCKCPSVCKVSYFHVVPGPDVEYLYS